MKPKTQTEIETEIKALRGLKPVGQFKSRTAGLISLAVEELESGIDSTAGEWGELKESERDIIRSTRDWKNGFSNNRPSHAWRNLVE